MNIFNVKATVRNIYSVSCEYRGKLLTHWMCGVSFQGFGVGLYEGVTGLVTKPVAGVLDLAQGMSSAVRDVSKRSSHMTPDRVREPRCCHGPGGLLPSYSQQQAESQTLLYRLNEQNFDET